MEKMVIPVESCTGVDVGVFFSLLHNTRSKWFPCYLDHVLLLDHIHDNPPCSGT